MPPVCGEYGRLFLDTHGYFYISAGEGGGRKIQSLVKILFFEMGIRRRDERAMLSVCVCLMMLNIYGGKSVRDTARQRTRDK